MAEKPAAAIEAATIDACLHAFYEHMAKSFAPWSAMAAALTLFVELRAAAEKAERDG
jgi:hypothetical protein